MAVLYLYRLPWGQFISVSVLVWFKDSGFELINSKRVRRSKQHYFQVYIHTWLTVTESVIKGIFSCEIPDRRTG